MQLIEKILQLLLIKGIKQDDKDNILLIFTLKRVSQATIANTCVLLFWCKRINPPKTKHSINSELSIKQMLLKEVVSLKACNQHYWIFIWKALQLGSLIVFSASLIVFPDSRGQEFPGCCWLTGLVLLSTCKQAKIPTAMWNLVWKPSVFPLVSLAAGSAFSTTHSWVCRSHCRGTNYSQDLHSVANLKMNGLDHRGYLCEIPNIFSTKKSRVGR